MKKRRTYVGISFLFLITISLAQSKEDILTKYFRVSGGVERWNNIRTMISQGHLLIQPKLPIFVYQKKPDYLRTVLLIDGKELSDVRKFEFGNCLIELSKPDHESTYEGKISFEGKYCYLIRLVHQKSMGKNSLVEYYLFDSGTYLPRAVHWGLLGQPEAEYATTYFDDYRQVDGLLLPFRNEIKSATGHTIFHVQFDRIILNTPLKDALLGK